MNTYTSPGYRAVRADTMHDAAEIFAGREARKRYGKSGYVRTCNQQAHAADGSLAEYDAFIGYTPAGKHNRGNTVGNNIRLTVYLA